MIFLGIILSLLAFSGAYAQQEPYEAKEMRNNDPSIVLRLSEDAADITVPDTLYMGLILAGTCDSITIPIINDDRTAIRIDSVYLAGDDFIEFTILEPASTVIERIEPGSLFHLELQFCSTRPLCSRTSLFLVARPVDGSLSPRLYRVRVGACAGSPQLMIDHNTVEFGSVDIGTCGNSRFGIHNIGNYPLRIDELQHGRHPFVIIEKDTIAGATILPGNARYLTVQFCPDAPGDVYDTVMVFNSASAPPVLLPMHGRGINSVLELADTVDFKTTLLGNCRDTVLVIRNNGLRPLSITSTGLDLQGVDAGFSVTMPVSTSNPLVILPGDTAQLNLRYCPTDTERAVTTLRIAMGSGQLYSVALRGDAVAGAVWLDTVSGSAGDLVHLHARIHPQLYMVVPITSYRFRLKLNLTALVPKQLIPARPDVTSSMTFDNSGIVTIMVSDLNSRVNNDLLFTLVLRGLSTADPANPVTIEEFSMPDIPSLSVAGHGLVLLDGCDIAHGGVQISRRMAFKSVATEPGRINLLYQASAGVAPTLSLYDLSGRLVKSFILEPGTGEDQRADLSAGPLHHGPYMLELSTESERVAVPVMIAQ